MKTLRPYQDAALKYLWKFIYDKPDKNPLVVAPVGAGKSLMIAEFIKQVHQQFPRTKVVMLTHVKELLLQNAEEMEEQYPDCDFGFYCAGLKQKRLGHDVTFASIQSINKKVGEFNKVPEIIIIDECHLISHKNDTTYRKFIQSVIDLNPNCKVIGFTGTPFRADTGRLDEGENKLFDDIAYEIGMDFMIDEGYWAKPFCPDVETKMDVDGVSVRGGDYAAGELERAVNTQELNDACVNEMLKLGKDRKKWLVFTAGVQHAEDVKSDLESTGISCDVVTGDTPSEDRKRIIESFRRGEIRCLVNVAVLTTGFNVPDIDLLAFMRPTRSPVLYIQTIGRGVRTVYADGYDLTSKEGRLEAIANSVKPDCMILDFGGVVKTLGPIDQVSVKKKYNGEVERDERGEAITKICPSCGAECAAGQRYCYSCSYCFIVLEETAGTSAVVSKDEPAQWLPVIGMHQSIHRSPDKPYPSMLVTYATMQGSVRQWICFEHWNYEVGDPKRFAWDKAVSWHNKRRPDLQVPQSVVDGINTDYPWPESIKVKKKGKYYEILDFKWPDPASDEDEEEYEIPF